MFRGKDFFRSKNPQPNVLGPKTVPFLGSTANWQMALVRPPPSPRPDCARGFLRLPGFGHGSTHPKSPNNPKTPCLHELFRKVRAKFCMVPCDTSQEPKINLFYFWVDLFSWIFLLWVRNGSKKTNKQKTHKHFSDGPCGTIFRGTNPHPSQGQTGQNGDSTVEFNRERPVCPRDGPHFVPGRGPICPRDGTPKGPRIEKN